MDEKRKTMKAYLLAGITFLLFTPALSAQHDGHHGTEPDSTMMTHAFSRHLPMTRNGSGTAWLPDASPMYGYMHHHPNWMFMLHGNLFLRYNHQDITNKGTRGGEQWDAPNWLMFMGQRRTGAHGLFHFSTMFSLDPLTVGGNGYPLLFQTGETWKGELLVDRQHPHDLFSELSVSYAHSFTEKFDAFVYLGYPGEPAIGSVVFMHRVSSLFNPDAPLSHHWNDATHITFGVATLGVRYGMFKLEASNFTGREPDEERYNFDRPRFDSWSGRFSVNPSENWALQVSQAFVKSPEALHPGEDVNRTTASVIYSSPRNAVRSFNATALWGLNATEDIYENALLAEAALTMNRLTFYTRYEWIQKSSEELDLTDEGFGPEVLFPINAITLGTAYDIFRARFLNMAAGGHFSVFAADRRLDELYGKNPVSVEVFLRFYPPRMM